MNNRDRITSNRITVLKGELKVTPYFNDMVVPAIYHTNMPISRQFQAQRSFRWKGMWAIKAKKIPQPAMVEPSTP